MSGDVTPTTTLSGSKDDTLESSVAEMTPTVLLRNGSAISVLKV